jgi:hypothetical protein
MVVVPVQPAPPPVPAPAAAEATTPKRTVAPEVFDGPAPPPVRPIDPTLKVDGGGLLLGASATEAWLYVDGYSVVVDKTTGCATESYPDTTAIAALKNSHDPDFAEAQLAKPEVRAALRDIVGLGRRFGAREHRFALRMVWSPDGVHIFIEVGSHMFGSADGGRSFVRGGEVGGTRLAVSGNGAHLIYERCSTASCQKREWVSLPTDGSRGPKPFTSGQTFPLRMGDGSRALFWRTDASSCLDTFDLGRPAKESSVCVPIPVKATGGWNTREWVSVSPSGTYGIVKWEEGRPNLAGAIALTYVVSLVDMKSGQIVKTVTDQLGDVDDAGNMVLHSMNEGGGDHTYFHPRTGPRKLLGNHSLLEWRNNLAVLSVWRKATLGARKCDLVKLVKTP